MANETTVTVVGNVTADPVDRHSGEWKDGDALFMRCTVWREPAEHVAESLTRGMRVVVTGRRRQRSFETEKGEKRTIIELDVVLSDTPCAHGLSLVVKTNCG
jgi:single-strand DNA-binding protein